MPAPKMREKDYNLIASVFKDKLGYITPNTPMFRACADIAHKLADELERDNPKFNKDKFLTACGLQDKGE